MGSVLDIVVAGNAEHFGCGASTFCELFVKGERLVEIKIGTNLLTNSPVDSNVFLTVVSSDPESNLCRVSGNVFYLSKSIR